MIITIDNKSFAYSFDTANEAMEILSKMSTKIYDSIE